jgi:hypothetical protein
MNCRDLKPHLLLLTEPEHAALKESPFNQEIALEAAMCAWEHIFEVQREKEENFDDFGGAGQARMCCGAIAEAIHIGYCIANIDDKQDGYAYDWEFVPWFVNNCVILDDAQASIHGYPDLVPNWVALCRALDFDEPKPEPQPSDEDLLRMCRSVLNDMPNQGLSANDHARDTYGIASILDRRLKRNAA